MNTSDHSFQILYYFYFQVNVVSHESLDLFTVECLYFCEGSISGRFSKNNLESHLLPLKNILY